MSNADQAEFWSGTSAQAWVDHQDAMDHLLAPVLDLLMQAADIKPGETILDIGCGTGTSTLRAAHSAGANGHVLGVDISARLLALAKERLAHLGNANIEEADAQTATFGDRFDKMISRFGVMFFADTAAAFTNIAQALKPGAPLVMVAWSDVRQNPFFTRPAAAARSVFGDLPKTDRSQPGPFAFEDPNRVRNALQSAGLADINIVESRLNLTPRGNLDDLAELCLEIGPAASAMQKLEGTAQHRSQLKAEIIRQFEPCQSDNASSIPALIHLICARNPVHLA
ncbi:MAG: methyltransferase domain-containing protein [Aliishimia sp.]